MPFDEPLERTGDRIEASLGISFSAPPTREIASSDALAATVAAAPRGRPLGGGALDEVCYELFRAEDPERPGSARSYAGSLAPRMAVYDGAANAVLLSASPAGRRAELERIEALALALTDQRLALAAAIAGGAGDSGSAAARKRENERGGVGRTRDDSDHERLEGRLAAAYGAALLATIEASIAPIFAFDASADPLRRRIEGIADRLIADADRAPIELLSDPELPSALRYAIEETLRFEGMERRRAVLRTFGGLRLVVRAKERGGAALVRRVLEDPPRSTEQLLHPDRYLDRDVRPWRIEAQGRDGLLGLGYRLVSTGAAGEFGLRTAMEGAVDCDAAAAAADGWRADALSVFREREAGRRGIAWRLEFDDRNEAREAVDVIRRAGERRYGGTFGESPDGTLVLEGGVVPAAVSRRESSVALVIGGDVDAGRRALVRLHDEVARAPEEPAVIERQDRLFRAFRAIASPLFYDERNRFDTIERAVYGVFVAHRTYEAGARHTWLNLSEFPLLGRWIPEETSGILLDVERGNDRHDTAILADLVRAYEDRGRGVARFWSPLVSRTWSPEYERFAVLYGALYESTSGAGERTLAPRPFFSKRTRRDGAETSYGVLFDAISLRMRERDNRIELLPFGAATSVLFGPGRLELGFLFDAVRLRYADVLESGPHTELALLDGYALRVRRDEAAGSFDHSILAGLLIGARSCRDGWSAGVGRIAGRHLLGVGGGEGARYLDLFFFRVHGS